jgi:uncharacterized membrane protein YdjX (TVP38/TMEM64 family)
MASQSAPIEQPAAASKSRTLVRILVALAVVALLIVAGKQLGGLVPQFNAWVRGLGIWAPVVFIAGYIVATVAFVPGSLLTLAAGAIFGLARGTAYVFVGATIGSILAFIISRYFARAAIERRLAGNEKFATIDRAVGAAGLKIVFLLRLSPVFPFNLLNYGLGLTRVRLRDYAIAALGMLPGTFLYVYYGKLAGDVAALAGGAAIRKDAGYWTVLIIGLAATIVVTTIVTRIARKALKEYG